MRDFDRTWRQDARHSIVRPTRRIPPRVTHRLTAREALPRFRRATWRLEHAEMAETGGGLIEVTLRLALIEGDLKAIGPIVSQLADPSRVLRLTPVPVRRTRTTARRRLRRG